MKSTRSVSRALGKSRWHFHSHVPPMIYTIRLPSDTFIP